MGRCGFRVIVMRKVWMIMGDGRVWVIRDHCDGEGVGD